MLPLDAKARWSANWSEPTLLKVAGLDEFASGIFPLERMLLDLRVPEVASAGVLTGLPWAGFLVDETSAPRPDRPEVTLLGEQAVVRPGDVVEIRPGSSKIAVRYRRGDNGNVLFATERCNSFCLMCSQPPRDIEDSWRVDQLCTLTELIDKDEPSLAISGGEPTLLGAGLIKIVELCARTLPNTHIHVLSNGRRFEDRAYANAFSGVHPSLTWGIPLYGDHYRLHDYIVQSPGAFSQTLRGLYALHAAGQRIEVRVVLTKPVVERLPDLARYLYRNLPFVEHVALMGTEPIGFAKAHYDTLWMDPVDMGPALTEAALFLTRRDMAVSLYNLPLCTLPEGLRPLARRSISNWKQHYLPACDGCVLKPQCGGFFSWITPEWTSRAIAPITEKEDTSCAKH